MNVFVVLQQMLVLLAMMMCGFFIFKKGWLDDHSYAHLSKIVVNVLNPSIIINGVLGKDSRLPGNIVMQNFALMVFYFILLVIISKPIVAAMHLKKEHRSLYELMTIFSNVGFMGIPVISSIFGQKCVVLIAFYMLGYNLVLYTYGLYLSSKSSNTGFTFQWKSLLNAGVLACIIAIVIFVLHPNTPDSIGTFFSYVGNSVVPLSMMLIGASVAQYFDKSFLTDIKMYIFSAVKMLVIPIAAALIIRPFGIDSMVKGVFVMMLAMPVGTIVVMFAKQAGADELECTKGSVLTTLLSIITIPIVAFFL